MAADRVMMRTRTPLFVGGDVEASISGPDTRYARRFSLTVAEDALQRLGPHVMQHIAERLGESVVAEHQSDITAAVHSFLLDRAWAEPIIKEAIRETVARVVREMLASSPLGRMQRDG